MNPYYRLLGALSTQGQSYPYPSLLKQEALMRLCAQQAQAQILCKKATLKKDLPN